MTLRTCRFRPAFAVAAGWNAAACVERDVNAEGQEREWKLARAAMVRQIRAYGVKDEGVLAAMGKVRRHVFIPDDYRNQTAYGDHPNPIGHDQTISQPFIVAYMTERLDLKRGEKVLESGTGSGYQAAVLAELGANVFSIEIVAPLAEHARRALTAEGCANKVHVLTGDGYQGWPEHAPFDAVIVTCAPEEAPPALVQQLAEGGRMILPLGAGLQRLVILRKKDGVIRQEEDLAVRFVPMVHGAPRAVNAKEQ